MDIIFFIAAAIVSIIVFKILFMGLNKSMLNLFGPIQRFVNRSDRKNIYKNVTFFMIVVGNVYIKDLLNLSYIAFGITFGLLFSLHDIVFDNKTKLKI